MVVIKISYFVSRYYGLDNDMDRDGRDGGPRRPTLHACRAHNRRVLRWMGHDESDHSTRTNRNVIRGITIKKHRLRKLWRVIPTRSFLYQVILNIVNKNNNIISNPFALYFVKL